MVPVLLDELRIFFGRAALKGNGTVHIVFMAEVDIRLEHFSGAVQRQIEVVSSGAIMAGVNVTKLKHIEIHLPDFDLQQQFAHFVGEVDSVKCSINNSLEKLETLKKALMQEYFG